MFDSIFEKFAAKSPMTVMARGMIERVFIPEQLDRWFSRIAREQYTKDLLFSSVFSMMNQVVCGTRCSVNAAYQAAKDEIGVSITSVYNKINGIEAETSANLVQYAAGQVSPVIEKLLGKSLGPLPGYRVKLLDGNCIEKSEHRIKELRGIAAGPLPGKSLVVYDPVLRIPIDVFPCEDGHAQERSLLPSVLLKVVPKDAWVADRNFCTVEFTCGIHKRGASFIIRRHQNYPYESIGKEKCLGGSDTGTVYEQDIQVVDQTGTAYKFRRIRIELKNMTRDGDKEISIITNLSRRAANGKKIADLYRGRWKIETAFQELTRFLNSEIKSLGYPRAALFGFCVALVAYMIQSVVMASLASVHGQEVIERVSGFYVADELSATYRGMTIAISDDNWIVFRHMNDSELLFVLKELAAKVKISSFLKRPRGPKKPVPKRISNKNQPHVSTAKIIRERKK
jgi:hypothetical protein